MAPSYFGLLGAADPGVVVEAAGAKVEYRETGVDLPLVGEYRCQLLAGNAPPLLRANCRDELAPDLLRQKTKHRAKDARPALAIATDMPNIARSNYQP